MASPACPTPLPGGGEGGGDVGGGPPLDAPVVKVSVADHGLFVAMPSPAITRQKYFVPAARSCGTVKLDWVGCSAKLQVNTLVNVLDWDTSRKYLIEPSDPT